MKNSVSCFLQHPVISHQVTALFMMYLFIEMLVTVSASGRPGPHLSKMSVEFKSSRVLEVNLTLTW